MKCGGLTRNKRYICGFHAEGGALATQRWLSLAELVAGAAIVIGHNVYHVIPNEVPILFVLGLISVRWRDGSWAEMGLSWPIAWRRTVLFAIAAAALRILLGGLVVGPAYFSLLAASSGATWL